MIILLDAMGGDNAPIATIKGAVRASKEIDAEIVLIGNEKIINENVKKIYQKENITEVSEKIKIHNTTEEITMEDVPLRAF